MKRNVRMLAGLLALMTALMLFAGTALAATTHSFTITVGEAFSQSYDNVGTASLTSGSLPPGISWSLSGTTFKLSGKPTKSGIYTATFTTTSSKRTAGKGYLIVDVTFKFTVSLKLTTIGDPSIIKPPVSSGGGSSSATVTPTPRPASITKDPTDETVVEGGSCKFAAKAENYEKARWHFISPSGEDMNYGDVKKKFPGLEISGGSGHTMTVSNIPLGMDGYRVYCRYTNSMDVATKTATALLTVTPKNGAKAEAPAAPTAAAAVTPLIISVTPEPAQPTPIVIYVTPEPTAVPAQPTAEPTYEPAAPPVQTGQGNANTAGTGAPKDHTVLFVLAGAAVLVVMMLCGTLIVIGRMKAKERARRERERRRREREKQRGE